MRRRYVGGEEVDGKSACRRIWAKPAGVDALEPRSKRQTGLMLLTGKKRREYKCRCGSGSGGLFVGARNIVAADDKTLSPESCRVRFGLRNERDSTALPPEHFEVNCRCRSTEWVN